MDQNHHHQPQPPPPPVCTTLTGPARPPPASVTIDKEGRTRTGPLSVSLNPRSRVSLLGGCSDQTTSERAAVGRQPSPSSGSGGLPGPPRRRALAGGGGSSCVVPDAAAAAGAGIAEHLPHDVHVAVLAGAHLLPQPPQSCTSIHPSTPCQPPRLASRSSESLTRSTGLHGYSGVGIYDIGKMKTAYRWFGGGRGTRGCRARPASPVAPGTTSFRSPALLSLLDPIDLAGSEVVARLCPWEPIGQRRAYTSLSPPRGR